MSYLLYITIKMLSTFSNEDTVFEFNIVLSTLERTYKLVSGDQLVSIILYKYVNYMREKLVVCLCSKETGKDIGSNVVVRGLSPIYKLKNFKV